MLRLPDPTGSGWMVNVGWRNERNIYPENHVFYND